ncbi:MAG: leucine-rich repeat domain-containing protein [Ardenticatenaceae bacterium]|nr:leucine-rich repeat domain-containing protein [Ardenticatenaceae bacterium]
MAGGQLTQLQSLNLSGNNLTELPEWLGQLTQLQSLYLSFNNLTELPEWLGQLTQLQSLNLSSNNLTELPEWLGQLTQLQSLDLSSTNLTELPEWLGQLTQLQSLDLSSTNLTELPEWLGQLTQLQSLNLSGNNLTELPEWLGQLTQLQSLYLSGNNLTELPEWLGQLTQLQSLYLSSNNLTELPEWLGQLTQLQSLNLSSNNLTELPEWLGQLTQLQSLNLSSNNLTELPEWLGNLTQLRQFFCAENPITSPPPEILGDALKQSYKPVDLVALRRYFAQLHEEQTVTFYEAKLLIVGEGGAGKTSLACKLQDDQSPLPEKEESTEGIDIVTWHFPLPPACEEEEYRVNIWDFGGQEVYFATHQFFLTHRSVYVLVADTRQQHTDFYTWLRLQETFGGSSPILLLKNRNRQKGSRFFIENLPQLRQRFPNLKDVIELDLESVPHEDKWPTLVRDLQHRFLSLDHVGVPRPATWVAVREALREDPRDIISLKQYLAICAQHKIERQDDALQLSDYLHHLGDILHFQKDPVLADLVILKPTWGLDAVYRVLDNETIVENWGKFSRTDLRDLWNDDKYDGHHHQLLRLMQNFQLCYPLEDEPDSYIAPQLLKPDVPPYDWSHENNLQLRYRYPEFMPRGILSRAIVKLHHRIERQTLVWRSGVILNDGYARSELLELRGENEIRIRVSGRNMRDLLMEIVRALDDLHLGFPKLQYEKRIPCNCSTCATLQEPHFYDLQELLDRLANRKETKECNKPPYEDVSIRSLLDDAAPQVLLKTDGPLDQRAIHNYYGNVYRGDHRDGDDIHIDEISESEAIAIGRKASARIGPPKN